jgi:FSR family fosmidomycin resistance protein-like MFS transporter
MLEKLYSPTGKSLYNSKASDEFSTLGAVALNHGLNDFISGFVLAKIYLGSTLTEAGLLLIIYNVLAFAMQFPFGLWADKSRYFRSYLIFSLILLTSAFIFSDYHLTAVLMAGIGSCLLHVCGGKFSLNIMPGQAKSVGIFAAPGVIGLALGGYFGLKDVYPVIPVLLVSLLILPFLIFLKNPEPIEIKPEKELKIAKREVLIIFLLLAITLRSAVWDIYQIIHYGNYDLLIPVGLAAAFGKISGGFIADRTGWKVYTIIALLGAAVFLTFSEHFAFLLAGIALLQSVTGIGTAAMSALMPKKPATAAGLTLGLAIALGGLPFFLGLNGREMNSFVITIILLTVIVFYVKGLVPSDSGNTAA